MENVLGEIGKGHKIAFNVLNVGRFKLGACVTGAGKFALRGRGGVREPAQAVRRHHRDLRRHPGEDRRHRGRRCSPPSPWCTALAGMIDDRLAAVPQGVPDYYEAYQRGHRGLLDRVRHREGLLQRGPAPTWSTRSSRSTAGTATRRSTRPRTLLPRRADQPDLRGDERDQPAAHPRDAPAPGHEGGDPAGGGGPEGVGGAAPPVPRRDRRPRCRSPPRRPPWPT